MITQSSQIIGRGILRDHEAGGAIVIERTAEGEILRLENYWIAPGAPDVRVYLSPDRGGNPEVAGAHDFGQVTSVRGEVMLLPIPEGISADLMHSVVVYCKVYSVTFAVATIEHIAV